jgi:hypothetical protein
MRPKEYQKIVTEYGEFVLIPRDEMEAFEIFSQGVDSEDLFIVCPSLVYFLSYVCDSDTDSVMVDAYADNV